MAKKKTRGKKRLFYWIIALIFFVALLISFRFDSVIVKHATGLRGFFLDYLLLSVTFLGSVLVVLFVLTSLFLWQKHKRRWILPLWLSFGFSLIISTLIKFVIGRARPYQIGVAGTLPLLAGMITAWNSSFPSLHAAVAFSALPVLDKEFPRFKFVWLGFACLVAFSRVYFALHYLSDVLVGAALGYFIGLVFVRLEEKYKYSKILINMFPKK